MDHLAWKAKIGLVVVSSSTVSEGRYPRVAPRDVGFFTSRMLLRGRGVTGMATMEHQAA
jgi:maleate cis-trans isomerase